MKKNLLPLLIIGFILVSCKKNDLSDSYWIAVKSYPNSENTFHYGLNGMTIHFSNDNIEVGNVFLKEKKEYELSFNNQNILLNDTLWSNIFVKYEDSLLLDFEENTRVKFVRLDKKNSINEKLEFWKHKDWVLSCNDYQRELFLTDSLFFDGTDSKICLHKNLQENQFIGTIDKWKTLDINGNQLFVKTFHQTDEELYRIKNFVGDSIIELEYLGFPDVKVTLNKRKNISETKRQEIIKLIQNHKWKTEKVIDLDTVSEGSRNSDFKQIKFESLKNKKLSFKFSDKQTYQVYESEISVANGNWNLSQTGNQIILNNGIYPSDYIDLISFDSNSLVIGNLRIFEPEQDNFGRDIYVYYKIELTK